MRTRDRGKEPSVAWSTELQGSISRHSIDRESGQLTERRLDALVQSLDESAAHFLDRGEPSVFPSLLPLPTRMSTDAAISGVLGLTGQPFGAIAQD